MANENIHKLDTNSLKRRKRLSSVLIGMLLVVSFISITIGVMNYYNSEEWSGTMTGGATCLLLGIILYSGRLKIIQELKRRGDTK